MKKFLPTCSPIKTPEYTIVGANVHQAFTPEGTGNGLKTLAPTSHELSIGAS